MTADEAKPPELARWHPRLRELYDYWRAIHPARGLPGRQHLNPADIPALLPQLWLLDVGDGALRFRYRLVGTRITEIVERELTGQWLDEAHPHVARNPGVLDRYRAVALSGQPSWRRGKPAIYLAHKADYTEIENGLFPLARDGKTVDMILACTLFFHRDGTEF